nr:Asp-tRNA(Asn)/Glu-tRNA(Gln) amidotransferase subunit GatC [Anaeromicropila herbilytica]
MSMKITDETIDYVSALAKLVLSQEEKEKAEVDLGNILGYIETMNELDTEGIEPMSHAFPLKNVFREDVVTNGDDRDNVLSNAPVKKDGSFVVPKTVE